jgi:chromosome segregation ATPase
MNAAAIVVGLATLLAGQGASRQPATPRAAQASRAESAQKADSGSARLSEAIETLSREVRQLRDQLALRDVADEFTVGQLRLMLLDERIARLEGERADLQARATAVAANERELNRRLGDIDTELVLYGGLNREESRRAITTSLTEQLNRAQEEQQRLRTRAGAVGAEVARARDEAEALRSHLSALARRLGKDGGVPRTPNASGATPAPYVPGVEQRRTESGQPAEEDEPESPN